MNVLVVNVTYRVHGIGIQVGTVTNQVGDAVRAAKQGRVDFRADKGGIVHVGLGKVCNFIHQNLSHKSFLALFPA